MVIKGEVRLLAAAEEGRRRGCVCVCVCVSEAGKCFLVCVCVCVCKWGRKVFPGVCVCVCVCKWGREVFPGSLRRGPNPFPAPCPSYWTFPEVLPE